ncbi:glycogen/starch synthase, partial [Acidithiobacillus ferriphilus]
MLRTLFVFSEMVPYSKTGGLADVGGALPLALRQLGAEVRVLVPYYGCPATGDMRWCCAVNVPYTGETAELWSPVGEAQILFLRYPAYYERDGGPYQDTQGEDWPDNDRRFALLNRVAVEIAQGRVSGLNWRPDIVHANDWQTGLIPYLLDLEARIGAARPAVLFTIHNLAYQGRFAP